MYLKKVFHYSRFLFFLTILFTGIQLYINLKVGVTATPFLHYGMYSSKYFLPSSIEVWELVVNTKKLNLQGYHPKIVDKILEPLNIFYKLPYDSGITYQTRRFLTVVSMPYKEANFHQNLTEEKFKKAYLKHLNMVLNVTIREIIVYRNTYSVTGADFKLTRKNHQLTCH